MPDGAQARPAQSPAEFGAVLIGFDVEGFSRTVEKATLQFGRVAGELAAQRILAGERVVTGLARAAGFRFADALGDGAVYLRAQDDLPAAEARAVQRLCEELRYAHLRETGMPARAAWTHGPIRLLKPNASLLEHTEMLWGPAVAQLHAGLSARHRARRAAPDLSVAGPDLAAREGEIVERAFVFLRLCRSEDWRSLDPARLDAALGLIGAWAGRLGGRLERVTQDEKGVHARVGLPLAGGGGREWRELLEEVGEGLRRLGLDGAVAAAGGPVYRGPSEHGSTIVHGGAVNRAAKLCAAQPPGVVAVHPSLAAPVTRADAGSESIADGDPPGRVEDARKARIWLASAGPRMVLLSGEAGIGKSHLLRRLLQERLATDGGDRHVHVAGAPARMLDPMGSWFEIVGDLVARKGLGAGLLDWAQASLARAGLSEADIGFVARGLPGLESVPPADPALSGGERAQRTMAALLALVGALTEEGSLVLAIDDLHELDEASLAFTRRVLDAGVGIKIIAAARPSPDGGDRLAELRGHLSALTLPLASLTADELSQVVRGLAPAAAPVGELMAISGGNPFQAIQAALALTDGAGDDPTLSAILDRRLDRLDVDESQVLRALSISERSWSETDLAAMLGEANLSRPLDVLLKRLSEARLVAPGAGRPESRQTAHRLLADVVRRRMPSGVRRRLALAAARRLSDRRAGPDAPDAEIARLWAEAGSRGRAAVLYERAARAAAAAGADATAARLLQLALDLFADREERRRPRRAVRWLAELARAQWSIGLVDVANQAAQAAAALARRRPLPPRLADSAVAAAALRAETGQFLGDLREIVMGSLEAGRFGADRRETVSAQGRGLSAAGYLLGMARLAGPADALLSRGERLADQADPRPAAYALTARAILHFIFLRWAAGEAALARARSICEAHPQHQLMEVIETTCGIGAHLQGDGARALAHFEALDRRAQARGADLYAGWADYAAAQTLLALDRPHEAWARLNAAEARLAGLTDRQSHHICLGLRARLAWRLGEIDEAIDAARRCGQMSATLAPTNYSSTEAFSAPPLIGALALLAPGPASRRRDAQGLVRNHLGELERYAFVFPIARPRRAMAQALAEAARRPAAAADRLQTAAEAARAAGLSFEADLAVRLRAEVLERI